LRRRLARGLSAPRLTTVWLRAAAGGVDATGLAAVLRNRVAVAGTGRLELSAAASTWSVHVTAWCDPRTLAGWVYRDPQGWDVHVAQSDVASCTVEWRTRSSRLGAWGPLRRLSSTRGAALEFHAPEPLPGVRYVAWDERA
jgi:hypothetical protein